MQAKGRTSRNQKKENKLQVVKTDPQPTRRSSRSCARIAAEAISLTYEVIKRFYISSKKNFKLYISQGPPVLMHHFTFKNHLYITNFRFNLAIS